jgi:hypothetical protein
MSLSDMTDEQVAAMNSRIREALNELMVSGGILHCAWDVRGSPAVTVTFVEGRIDFASVDHGFPVPGFFEIEQGIFPGQDFLGFECLEMTVACIAQNIPSLSNEWDTPPKVVAFRTSNGYTDWSHRWTIHNPTTRNNTPNNRNRQANERRERNQQSRRAWRLPVRFPPPPPAVTRNAENTVNVVGDPGVLAHNTAFINEDWVEGPRPTDDGLSNYMYLQGEVRRNGTVPRVYHERAIADIRRGLTGYTHPFTRQRFRSDDVRRLR